ncbi:MAG: TFIIB-type zinc ribbon-containing protein [Verrucomicrobia bacterium]|nr:TFIIB-type zinc ribbon-containing protein [Verrucomicrobiota bacterium]
MILCPFCGTRLERNEQGYEVYCRACGYDVLEEPPRGVQTQEAGLRGEDRVKLVWHLVIALVFIAGAFWLVFDVSKTPLTVVSGLIFIGAMAGYGTVGAVLRSIEPVSADTILDPIGCITGQLVHGLILRLMLHSARAIADAASGLVRLVTRWL